MGSVILKVGTNLNIEGWIALSHQDVLVPRVLLKVKTLIRLIRIISV